MKSAAASRRTVEDKTAAANPEAFSAAVADEKALRAALEEADIVPQLLVQAQVSGDTDLLEEARPYIKGAWSFLAEIPDALAAKIRNRLVDALKARAANNIAHQPSRETLGRIMSVGIGQPIPDDYVDMFLEEMGDREQDPRRVHWRRPVPKAAQEVKIVIVGAGLSGLCMGIKLREAGIPFTIYEKNAAVGGTWFENSYPGCAVDIPNHFYSFSFERKSDWSRHFAKRDELWSYLEHCADKYDVRRDIHFDTEVSEARFDDKTARWNITVKDTSGASKTVVADIFVPAVGQLNKPSIPNIPGFDTFKGPAFHTARWDHSVDVAGKRVALVGTGASAMQTGPSIAPKVARLLVFQRSRHWTNFHPLYHREVSEGMKWALRHIPYFAEWYRFQLFWASGDVLHEMLQVDPAWPSQDISLNATNHEFRERLLNHIKSELADRPDLIEKVVPPYPPYGKRMLRDNHWFKMLKRDNVELINDGIARVEPDAVIDTAGKRHPVDMIVLATGFQATRMMLPMEIYGRGGKRLREVWEEENPRAFLGVSVPEFPNMFILFGPNTAVSHGGSMFFQAECQVRYVMQCLREMLERDLATMEIRVAPHDEYNRQLDELHGRMVWTHRGVKSWYKNAKGRVTTLMPWRLVDYWKMTHALNPSDYVVKPKSERPRH
jgi:4-hydroxyacetophenone monooxygenase